MEFRLGELFCGPGGLALAATSCQVPGMSIIHGWANDYDFATCQTYIHNICPNSPETVICQDVRELDIDSLVKFGPIDAFAFGFPCNDYSLVGQQKGLKGNFGPLYSYGVSVLKKFRPKWFLAENVSGLRGSDGGKTFRKILKELKQCEYDVYPHLYKFEEYGVPQARHRVIIVGIRRDLNLDFRIPSPEDYHTRTCREAIECPSIPKNALNNEFTKQSQIVIERLKNIKPGENAFNARIPEHLKLNVRGKKISQIYKRLDPDKPSYTVTGSGGGGTHIYHWKENRALTNRERARLQTFPDDFFFVGSKEEVRRQIGMAVPPEGARIIFEAILKTFAGIEYKAVPLNKCLIKDL